MNKISLSFSIVSLILIIILFFRINQLKSYPTLKDEPEVKSTTAHEHHEEEPELADYMHKLQLYMNKLYFSGKNNNMDLVKFYLHELKEIMEEVEEENIVDEGIEISSHMSIYGLSPLRGFEEDIKSNGLKNFEGRYKNMISSCNGCHATTEHPFIQVKLPETPAFDNQIFK